MNRLHTMAMTMWMVMAAALALLAPQAARGAELILTPQELHSWQETAHTHLLIDVRHASLFEAAHIPGAMNVPAELLPFKGFPADKDLVLYDNDLSGMTARKAGAALAEKTSARIYLLRGGLRAWEEADFASTRPAGLFDPAMENLITGEDLREAIRIGMPVQVVDLRDAKSFKSSSVPGAMNVPLLKSADELAQLKSDRLELVLNLSSKSQARLKSTEKQTDKNAAAEAAADELIAALNSRSETLKAAGKPAAKGPIVIVDNGGALSAKVLPTLKNSGSGAVLVLERGIVGWEASGAAFQTGPKEAMFHGSTSFDAKQILKDNAKE